MCIFISNRAASQIKTRIEIYQGREYWVAPLTMMTEGVHAGSKGPVLYTADELIKSAQAWNLKPIVINHPRDTSGNFISANSVEVLTKSQVGFVLNAKWIGKLVAEAWIDRERAEKLDKRIATALATNAMMEVSTGLFNDVDARSGNFRGKSFLYSAINHRPDHRAILPDEKGACSISCGCGLNANSRPLDPLRLPVWSFNKPSQAIADPSPANVPVPSRTHPLTMPVWTWDRK